MNDDGLKDLIASTRNKNYTAERIYVHACGHIPKAMLDRADVVTGMDHTLHKLVVHLRTYMHGMVRERFEIHERWPATWWDAVKERWFPAWAKRRWPVEWRSIDVDKPLYSAVCPHLEESGRDVHLKWMVAKHEDTTG